MGIGRQTTGFTMESLSKCVWIQFSFTSLSNDTVFILRLQNTKFSRLGFLWRLSTKELKKVAYLLASLAASAAALPLTRRDTLDIAPARKQSTMPWFLRGQ